MISVPCHCGEIIETELNEIINLEKNPGIYQDILEGSFMSFSCPKCGNVIKTEVPVHLIDKTTGIDLQFLPELERTNYLSGNIEVTAKRLAVGYKELAEKIVISGEELDDRIIEIIKFQLLEKSEIKTIQIFLDHIENDELIFYIHGLKPDQLGVTRIPRRVYDQVNSKLNELLDDENIRLFTTPPYISVNRVYLED